jgi:hypothetical protein
MRPRDGNDGMMERWGKQKAAFPTFPHPLEIFQISTFPSLYCCLENTKSRRTANLNLQPKCQPCARSKVSTISPAAHSAVPTGLNFERVVLTQTLPNCAHVLATGPPGLASMAICAVSFLSQIAIGKSVPSTASRDRRDDKLEGGPLAWAEGGWTDSTNQDLHTYPDCPLTLSIRRLNRSMQRFFT